MTAAVKPLKIAILLGSYREGRLATRVGRFIESHIVQRGHTALWVDPKEANIPLLTNRYSAMTNPPEGLVDIAKKMQAADAFVLVSAEYNGNPPPGLTNLLNHFYYPEYLGKVGGIVSYSMGNFGGARASLALRPLLGEIGLVSIPKLVPVPTASKTLTENGETEEPLLKKNATDFVAQLEWYASALRDAREKGGL